MTIGKNFLTAYNSPMRITGTGRSFQSMFRKTPGSSIKGKALK
jgi:hypothetical protein